MITDQAELSLKLLRKKKKPYDEKGDLDSWFEYFEIATSDSYEEKRIFELKKVFLNTSVAKHIRGSENIILLKATYIQ